MPDMDGFKLLELVGLEMDLPVISKCSSSFDRPRSWIAPSCVLLLLSFNSSKRFTAAKI